MIPIVHNPALSSNHTLAADNLRLLAKHFYHQTAVWLPFPELHLVLLQVESSRSLVRGTDQVQSQKSCWGGILTAQILRQVSNRHDRDLLILQTY